MHCTFVTYSVHSLHILDIMNSLDEVFGQYYLVYTKAVGYAKLFDSSVYIFRRQIFHSFFGFDNQQFCSTWLYQPMHQCTKTTSLKLLYFGWGLSSFIYSSTSMVLLIKKIVRTVEYYLT